MGTKEFEKIVLENKLLKKQLGMYKELVKELRAGMKEMGTHAKELQEIHKMGFSEMDRIMNIPKARRQLNKKMKTIVYSHGLVNMARKLKMSKGTLHRVVNMPERVTFEKLIQYNAEIEKAANKLAKEKNRNLDLTASPI